MYIMYYQGSGITWSKPDPVQLFLLFTLLQIDQQIPNSIYWVTKEVIMFHSHQTLFNASGAAENLILCFGLDKVI